MESVKSIVKDVVYGKSKIHTNVEFTFSNNKKCKFDCVELELRFRMMYNQDVLKNLTDEEHGSQKTNQRNPGSFLWFFSFKDRASLVG